MILGEDQGPADDDNDCHGAGNGPAMPMASPPSKRNFNCGRINGPQRRQLNSMKEQRDQKIGCASWRNLGKQTSGDSGLASAFTGRGRSESVGPLFLLADIVALHFLSTQHHDPCAVVVVAFQTPSTIPMQLAAVAPVRD